MNGYVKLGLTLLVICGIAAGALAGINSVTAPIIAENQRQESLKTYFNIVGDQADDFIDVESGVYDEVVAKYNNLNGILEAKKGGETIGYVFKVFSNGFDGKMNNAIIIATDGTILGYRNLTNTETPGFGKQIEEPMFYERFNGKSVANSDEIKIGSGGAENEIEAISGSTISSKGVVKGLNEAVSAYKEFFENK